MKSMGPWGGLYSLGPFRGMGIGPRHQGDGGTGSIAGLSLTFALWGPRRETLNS